MVNATKYFCQDQRLLEGKDFGIRVLGIHERMSPQIIHRPAGTPDYFFCMFYKPFVLKMANGIHEYTGNKLMIWPPDTGHYYGHPDCWWEHTWMHVFGTKVDKLINNLRIPVGEPFEVKQAALMAKYVRMILDEIVTNHHADTIILFNYFQNLLRELKRDGEQKTTLAIPGQFTEVKAYIEANFRKKIRLDELAKMANLSVPQFCARFKRFFGTSAIDYQIQLRMQDAAFLMRDINMNISQIALACGYDDMPYFSKLFHRSFGKSPREYRQQLAGGAKQAPV